MDLLEQVSGSTALSYLDRFKAPRWLFRTVACLVLGGQVMARIFKGECPGPGSASQVLQQQSRARSRNSSRRRGTAGGAQPGCN